MYPFPLEEREAAGRSILTTCLNSEVNFKIERALKKNQGRSGLILRGRGLFCLISNLCIGICQLSP
jgi:hypothetical protein